jgi:5-methylcytosine-specific restriction enzyme A
MTIRNHRSPARRPTGPDALTVEAVVARAQGRSEISGEELQGVRGEDWHVHHRRPRGAGGSKRRDTNGVENLLVLSAADHELVESQRTLAYARGWLVRQNAIPAAVPVQLLVEGVRRLVLLTDDGGYRPVEDVDLPEVG